MVGLCLYESCVILRVSSPISTFFEQVMLVFYVFKLIVVVFVGLSVFTNSLSAVENLLKIMTKASWKKHGP